MDFIYEHIYIYVNKLNLLIYGYIAHMYIPMYMQLLVCLYVFIGNKMPPTLAARLQFTSKNIQVTIMKEEEHAVIWSNGT